MNLLMLLISFQSQNVIVRTFLKIKTNFLHCSKLLQPTVNALHVYDYCICVWCLQLALQRVPYHVFQVVFMKSGVSHAP